jgi:molecular chaperone DnaK
LSDASKSCLLENEIQAPEKKLAVELQVGGPGSGIPPAFRVATGAHNHAVIGIDIGSRWTRVAALQSDTLQLLSTNPISSTIRLPEFLVSTLSVADKRHAARKSRHSVLSLVGSDWEPDANYTYNETLAGDLLRQYFQQIIDQTQKSTEKLIKKCVISVPSSLNAAQRALLRQFVENSGLEVLHLINKPTAAALFYLWQRAPSNGHSLVLAMGANNFAISIFEQHNGILEGRAATAARKLGGDRFDEILAELLFENFQRQTGMPLPQANLEAVMAAAETAKKDLSMSGIANVRLLSLEIDRAVLNVDQTNFFTSISQDEFEQRAKPLIDETERQIDSTLKDARLNNTDIDYVIPVGLPTAMHWIQQLLKNKFPKAEFVYGQVDSAPALGAALHASLVTRNAREFVVWDVLPMPIGVETPGGKCKVIVSSGTPLPITSYHRVESIDATVNLHVVQGHSKIAAENYSTAEVTVNNCPPTTTAGNKIEIGIMVRADGTLDFAARHVELQVNLPLSVRIGLPSGREGRAAASAPEEKLDLARLLRLGRKMNMSEEQTLAVLRAQGYSKAQINNGTAIESMIRSLSKKKRARK